LNNQRAEEHSAKDRYRRAIYYRLIPVITLLLAVVGTWAGVDERVIIAALTASGAGTGVLAAINTRR
jgi:hypothetical protein